MSAALLQTPAADAVGSASRVLTLTALLVRPSRQGRAALALPVVAFAVTTALLLTVVGGTLMFLTDPRVGPDDGLIYATLSILALILLAVPTANLGAAAARLSSRRRNDRLATLRLLGATSREVSAITVIEATATALAGAVAGIVLYVALLPLVGLLPFFGGPVGAGALWTGWLPILAVVLAVALLATASAASSLRRVRLTPLGVARRSERPPRRLRTLGLGAVGLAVVALVVFTFEGFAGALAPVIGIGVLLALFAGALALVNLIGGPIVAARGRMMARRANDVAHLIAGREMAAHSSAVWRRVSGVAMISFIAVVGGSGMSVAAMADPGNDVTLFGDIRTGVLVTLGAGFVLLACSVGVTQAASVLEDAALIVGLDRLGVPTDQLAAARRISVMTPLRWAAVGGAGVGILLSFPIVGITLLTAPTSLVVIALTFALGFAAVGLALAASRPLVTAVLRGAS